MNKKLFRKLRQFKSLEQTLFRRHSTKDLYIQSMIWTFLGVHSYILIIILYCRVKIKQIGKAQKLRELHYESGSV